SAELTTCSTYPGRQQSARWCRADSAEYTERLPPASTGPMALNGLSKAHGVAGRMATDAGVEVDPGGQPRIGQFDQSYRPKTPRRRWVRAGIATAPSVEADVPGR